ncbi:MAG: N-6 DNA methylase, partial [Peptoniphilus harei]|nr:N-6 DNA methylase [Peptoniphilus harei]
MTTTSKDLKGCFIEGTFTTRNLGANDIKKLVDEVNKISHKAFGEEKDLIGHVYEYFLKEFAVNATKEEGEFYTPHDVVQLIASMIEPYDGTLYDPACGFRVIIVIEANSYVNIRSSRLLPKFKTQKINSW